MSLRLLYPSRWKYKIKGFPAGGESRGSRGMHHKTLCQFLGQVWKGFENKAAHGWEFIKTAARRFEKKISQGQQRICKKEFRWCRKKGLREGRTGTPPKSSGVPNNSQNSCGAGTGDRDGSEGAWFGFPWVPIPAPQCSAPAQPAQSSQLILLPHHEIKMAKPSWMGQGNLGETPDALESCRNS